LDCEAIYFIQTIPHPEGQQGKQRTARPGKRHRRDNGPQELQVNPVPPPDPKQLGTLTRYTREIIEGGPRALIAAQHRAQSLSAKFGEEIEAHWCLTTPWLKNLPTHDASGRNLKELNQGRVRYALAWRPRYLAALALSGGAQLACRAAKVSIGMVRIHRKADHDFDQQCVAAEEHAIELLHDVTMQSAIEGECEPIYWQGIEVGHIRKIDNRLRIEMLRAKMPKVFQTPGTKVAINTGDQHNTFICGPEEQDRLIALRRESLERIAAKKRLAFPAGIPINETPAGVQVINPPAPTKEAAEFMHLIPKGEG